MGLLDVDPAGLQALATRCRSWSAGVAATTPPTSSAGSCQATAAAVNLVHAATATAGAQLATRIQTVASSLTTAAAHYSSTDDSSASDLAALGRRL
ncbi:type VII secretion target [Mycobacterium sp. CVI_P3]|uniref:Type VII secretion target n=1 Tax=Mycobacterium pinniadriaticum TaxID=2994102 RepID=A0ABT3S953_9MYCO|nr:type VII secretion target [Mycobacterium pinniadriaticum]MCX2929239.1 type VII secretion target [Mycobacterium pinniadriaticum]MCX2935664.1 type VII secretion target [Mycobacterium pinniadriaticum]